MYMSGGSQSINITLRNPLDYDHKVQYTIIPHNNQLAKDWVVALKKLLQSGNLIEKNFCFMGFPKTARNIEYLCNELNSFIYQINQFNASLAWIDAGLESYIIEDYFVPDSVRFGTEYKIANRFHKEGDNDSMHIERLGLLQKHKILNRLHNHFERLQGTVNNLSEYYVVADYSTKYAIRQLNVICHEMEALILSQQKQSYLPEWIRPSQITTWLNAPRNMLTNQHKELFLENGYDRKFGHVYMHWGQIGKTLFEVFRDENAPELTDTVCEAITELEYYSGEFDVEWGRDTVYGDSATYWHTIQQDEFKQWLVKNGKDILDSRLSLGYLPIGYIDLESSFGTTDRSIIWDILSDHLDIYSIEVDGVVGVYDYCWSDSNFKQMQIDMMKSGYDFSSRG